MDEPDFKDAGARRTAAPERSDPDHAFEQHFLEFAYTTTLPINATSVAWALKIPIADAEERLEDLAARDVLLRDVDDQGHVSFRLPGRPTPQNALVPVGHVGGALVAPAPTPPQATAGLVLNLVFPGVGSIVAGKTIEGALQLALLVIALPLCFLLIGIPMCVAVWGWALSTSMRALHESQRSG